MDRLRLPAWVQPVFRSLRVITMAVPKRKHSNARSGSRRAHNAIKPRQLTFCPKCGTTIPTHVVCPNCQHYMGRKVSETE